MSGHADTIREAFSYPVRRNVECGEVALNALVAELREQADRIAWLEGEVAGWRIKLAECEERAVRGVSR